MTKEKYFCYLDQLRKSGAVNMFGAVPYLQVRFLELMLDRARAQAVLREWMDSHRTGGET